MSSAIQIFKKTVRASSGTQSNELAAKIKSVTSSTTIGAVFIYDTRNDSDGGAWRKKCAGLSWYDEALNQTTRGGRREFPSVALIVADNGDPNGTARTITIYDLDDVAAPAWMVFEASSDGSKYLWNAAGGDVTGIAALNGQVYISVTGGGFDKLIKFADDELVNLTGPANPASRISGPIANRNATGYTDWTALPAYWINQTVSSTSNDCAMTVLEGAEIGALGLPIPTIAVASGGGVSVIHPNGDVYDLTSSSYASPKCAFDVDNSLFALYETGSARRVHRFLLGQLYSDTAAGNNESIQNLTNTGWSGAGMALGLSQDAFSFAGKNKFALGGPSGLHLWKRAVGFDALNTAEPPNLNAYITSTYNTGYMLGDIRLALAVPYASSSHGYSNGNTIGDRSVKANNLTTSAASGQQVTAVPVATDAETFAFSNFSSSNYLSRAYDSDFDFGTGDFSVMLWIKEASNSTSEYIISRSTSSSSPHPGFYGRVNTDGTTTWFSNDNSTEALITSTQAIDDSTWHQIVFLRRSGRTALFIDGSEIGSSTNAAGNMDNSSAVLEIGRLGVSGSTTNPLTNGSLSLVRLSATAPTPQQVKDIYEAEAPLFRAGAKCLLQSDSGVSPNGVEDLAFDGSTGLLHVAQRGNTVAESRFRGLEMVESVGHKNGVGGWDYADISIVAANAGVVASARTNGINRGVITDLPPFDVRGDTNIADTKLPDDGKLHFTGVTTSNGGDVLGHIPIGENENVTVKAHVTAKGYGSNLGTHYANYVLTEQFYRAAGGDVTSAVAEASIVSQESAAGLDATIGGDGQTGRTIKITVTGDASDRIVWTASVEVIRDAEKSYER